MKIRLASCLALVLTCMASSSANAGFNLQFVPNDAVAETPISIDGFGNTIAATETIISVGCPHDKTKGIDAGAVYQFDATTGNLIRKIYGYAAGAGKLFGASVAVSGNVLAVGAPGYQNNTGMFSWHDVNTGALKGGIVDTNPGAKLGSSIAIAGDIIVAGRPNAGVPKTGPQFPFGGAIARFMSSTTAYYLVPLVQNTSYDAGLGNSIAISGNTVFVGAPKYNGSGTDSGAVYAFDLSITTGAICNDYAIIDEPTVAAGNQFGSSVLINGNTAYIGAPHNNAAGADAGAIYAMTLGSALPPTAIAISGLTTGDMAGTSMSISGNLFMIGLPGRSVIGGTGAVSGAGVAKVLKLEPGFPEFAVLSAPEPVSNGAFGRSVSLAGSLASAGGFIEGSPAEKGTVYAVGPLRLPVPFTELYRRVNAIPGIPGSSFGAPIQQSISPDGIATLVTTITGKVIGAGVFRSSGSGAFPILRTGLNGMTNATPATTASAILSAIGNANGERALLLTSSGPGITKANDVGFFYDDGSVIQRVLQEGAPILTTAKIGTLNPPYQSMDGALLAHSQLTMKLVKGTAAVAAAEDTMIASFAKPSSLAFIRESDAFDASSDRLGEITPQHSIRGASGLFIAGITGLATSNQGLFSTSSFGDPLVRRGGLVEGTTSATFGSILGVTQNATHYLVKATINAGGIVSGSDKVATANNEILYANTGIAGAGRIIARKGTLIDGLPQDPTAPTVKNSLTIKQFVEYALLDDDTVVAKVIVQGPGIKATNDTAIVSFDSTGKATIALRKGLSVQGNGGGTISNISAWQTNSSGHYVALCTLVGAAKGTDQILLEGNALDGSVSMVTRKGAVYDTEGSEVVKSIVLTPGPATASGAPNGAMLNGSSQLINANGKFVFSMIFNDNREIVYLRE